MHPAVHGFPIAVTAEVVAVVGGEDDEGVVSDAQPFERVVQPAELVVQRGYVAVVVGDLPPGEGGELFRDVGRQVHRLRVVDIVRIRILVVGPVRRSPAQRESKRPVRTFPHMLLHEPDRQRGFRFRRPPRHVVGALFVLVVGDVVVVVIAVVGRHVIEAVAAFRGIGTVSQVPLADIGRAVAVIPQDLRQQGLVTMHPVLVVHDAVDVGIAAGHELTAVGRTDGTTGKHLVQHLAFRGEPVQVGCLYDGVPAGTHGGVPVLVVEYEEDVGAGHDGLGRNLHSLGRIYAPSSALRISSPSRRQ